MVYHYSYLIGCLTLFIIWGLLFFIRKDTKKEMLIISFLFGIGGLIVDPIYSSDWWFPMTITNTLPGIESFLFGFSVAGIASIIYLDVLRKKLKIKKANKSVEVRRNFNLFLIGFLLLGLFFGFYFILKWNSFWASFPAFLIPLGIIYFKRRDLIINSVFSGLLLAIVSFLFYWIPELVTPGWILNTWNFEMISGILIFGVPLEDLVWFFLAGLIIGPYYEYWKEARVVDEK